MTHESTRIAPRGRLIVLGGLVALACSACASEEIVATMPAGNMAPPPMTAANDPSKTVASAPLGYPWMNGSGPSLPSAIAKAPVVTR